MHIGRRVEALILLVALTGLAGSAELPLPTVDEVIATYGWLHRLQPEKASQGRTVQGAHGGDPLLKTVEARSFQEYMFHVGASGNPGWKDKSQAEIERHRLEAIRYLRVRWERNFRERKSELESGHLQSWGALLAQEWFILLDFRRAQLAAADYNPISQEDEEAFVSCLRRAIEGVQIVTPGTRSLHWERLCMMPHSQTLIERAVDAAVGLPPQTRRPALDVLLHSNLLPDESMKRLVDVHDLLDVLSGWTGLPSRRETLPWCLERMAREHPDYLVTWIDKRAEAGLRFIPPDFETLVFEESFDVTSAVHVAKGLARSKEFLIRLYNAANPSDRLIRIQDTVSVWMLGEKIATYGPGDPTRLLVSGQERASIVEVALYLLNADAMRRAEAAGRMDGEISLMKHAETARQLQALDEYRSKLRDETLRIKLDETVEALRQAARATRFMYSDYLGGIRPPSAIHAPPPADADQRLKGIWLTFVNRDLRRLISHQLQELHRHVAKAVVDDGKPFPTALPGELLIDPLVNRPCKYLPWKDEKQLTDDYILAISACKLRTGSGDKDAYVLLIHGSARISECQLSALADRLDRINTQRTMLGLPSVSMPNLHFPPVPAADVPHPDE